MDEPDEQTVFLEPDAVPFEPEAPRLTFGQVIARILGVFCWAALWSAIAFSILFAIPWLVRTVFGWFGIY
jgi:hypothetical protein